MIRGPMQGLTTLALALMCAASAFDKSGTRPPEVVWQASGSPRSILQLDKDWMLHTMPGFRLWPPESCYQVVKTLEI